MDLGDPRQRAVFFEIHSGLPREGPGNRQCTARALDLARPLPPAPAVLDIGCGPGAQTMDLADLLLDAVITAVDLHEPFVLQTNRRARERGVEARVRASSGDMTALAFPQACFDLIWCEGAAYMMGVGAALAAWRPLLKPGGRLALSEAVWLRPDPPAPVRRFWAEYPAMGDVAAARALVDASGYRLLGDFVLPDEAWMMDYYEPLRRRIAALEPRFAGDPVARAVLEAHAQEIAVFERYAAWYGYLFLVMTPTAESPR
jgi:SAM-dependent methyltransferase